MTQISSDATQVYKRALPIILPLYCLFFLAALLDNVGMGVIVVLVFSTAFFLWYRSIVVPLADEVWNEGECLRVKRRGIEERIRLEDIAHLEGPTLHNPPRVTLTFSAPNQLGDSVTFMPKGGRGNLFLKDSVIKELERQIYLVRLLKKSSAEAIAAPPSAS